MGDMNARAGARHVMGDGRPQAGRPGLAPGSGDIGNYDAIITNLPQVAKWLVGLTLARSSRPFGYRSSRHEGKPK